MNEKMPENSLTIKIECVGMSELDKVQGILDTADKFLLSIGLEHWKNFYTLGKVAQYIMERKVYLLTYEGTPAGTIITTTDKNSSGWKDNLPSLYLSSLAVLPDYQEKGLGSVLLTAAEKEARALGLSKLRFDSVKGCDWLSEFYIRRGYSIVGEWGRPYRKFDYFLYEKDLLAQEIPKKMESSQ